ncbi:PTS sugar transporter subunit IIC [Pectinatus sottacetonis]|uniref:PTS sugar transporter subunit IIC n=1 Tax=Pectinatus sottacetonis TaxID=1002795 RepID=UPI001E43175B|nr:PTS transporter subunit EIIC [Pectinatus sottacetonis]
MDNERFSAMTDKFAEIAVKVGNNIYLRTLRDSFITIMPVFILAGLAVLINNVIFPLVSSGEELKHLQVFGNVLTNGTLNIAGLLISVMIAYIYSVNKEFKNPISTVVISLSSLIIMMSSTVLVTPDGSKEAVSVMNSVLSFNHIGTKGMFAGIIIGLVSSMLYVKLTELKHLQINMPEGVPPQVGKTFSVLLSSMITLIIMGVISAFMQVAMHTDLIKVISTLVQEPLRQVNTSLPGYLLIYSCGNILFSLGIHQSVINGSLLDPIMLVNMNENMQAVQAGHQAMHIINSDFQTCFAQMGGTGLTISLLLAIFLFNKYKPYNEVAKLGLTPGIFEINEPIIFGLPIVFNIPMMIPFVLSPIIGACIGYFATAIGFIKPLFIFVPWTTPPLISGFLSSGGDWKVVLVQIIIIAVTTLFYIPFLKISEKVAIRTYELDVQSEGKDE